MKSKPQFRAGLVGAGYVSEYHIAAVRRSRAAELAGVFDVDAEKADQAAARAGTKAYSSLPALCQAVDVIHVLTPPHTHAAVALQAIAAGCHVLIEKPLATDVADCESIRAAADAAGRKVCVNHSLLFDPQIRRALTACRSGKLGRVVSVDILRSSAYPPYRGGPLPPQYRSAGYPFRDLGVHELYLLQAFLGPISKVVADWRSVGGDPNLAFDEWRAQVGCRDGLGQFQLSWNVRPLQHQVIIQGTHGVLRADLFLMSQTRRSPFPVKAAERVFNAMSDSVPMTLDVPRNVFNFVTKRALPFHGLQDLVAAFYDALAANQPMPVTVDDAIPVVQWTESVARQADHDYQARVAKVEPAAITVGPAGRAPVLLTGASGSVGGAVARVLAGHGIPLRLFVRRLPETVPRNAEVVVGNLGDPDAVRRAARGASAVIHAGAAMKGGWPEHECATVNGTRNVLDAIREFGIPKLVYISSMSVVEWGGTPAGAVMDETSPLEPRAAERGAYTRAKLEAERLVAEYVERFAVPAVILRPGKIFGPRLPLLSPAIGWKVKGRWIVLGDGEARLPLIHIDDVADAILAAFHSGACRGEVIQIVDPVQPTQNQVLRRIEGPAVKIVHIPRALLYALGGLSQILLKLLGRKSPLSPYRLKSALAHRRFESRYAEALLQWQPKLGVDAGISRETGAASPVSERNEHQARPGDERDKAARPTAAAAGASAGHHGGQE